MTPCRLSLLILTGLFVCPAAAPAAEPPLSDAAARKILAPFVNRDTRRVVEAILALQKDDAAARESIRGLGRLLTHSDKEYQRKAQILLRSVGPAAVHALPSFIEGVRAGQ